MTDKAPEKHIDPGVSFTEIFPGTYCAFFQKYEPDKEQNAVQARHYLTKLKEILANHPGQDVHIINDTTLIGNKVLSLSSAARKDYLEALGLPGVGKVAMVGFGPWLKKFISFLTHFANHLSQTAFFDTREEAVQWIKKDDRA